MKGSHAIKACWHGDERRREPRLSCSIARRFQACAMAARHLASRGGMGYPPRELSAGEDGDVGDGSNALPACAESDTGRHPAVVQTPGNVPSRTMADLFQIG